MARHLLAVTALTWRAGRGIYLGLVVLTLVAGLLPAGIAWTTKLLVDGIAAGADPPGLGLVRAAVMLTAAALVMAVEPYLSSYLGSELGRRVGRRVQSRLYSAVTSYSGLSRFESPQFLDRLRMATMASGGALSPATTGLLGVCRSIITLLSLLGTLAVISPAMAGVVVLTAIPALAAQVALSRRNLGTMLEISPANRRHLLYSSLVTDLQAAKEIRLLGIGSFLGGRLLGELDTVQDGERAMERRVARVQSSLALLGAGVSGLGLIWLVAASGSGRYSAGDVTAFIAAVAGAQGALTGLVAGIAAAHESLLMYDQYHQVTHLPDDLPQRTRVLPGLRRGIELRDVWFRYDDTQPWVLRGVDLDIPAGRSLALVGLNGAGKSTLIKLLCRFYDPTRGTIRWDGVDLRDVPSEELRRRMGVLFQDFMSYDLTAAENIGLGDLTALTDRRRIEDAARAADVHEHLAGLHNGYGTLLSRLFLTDADKDDPSTGVALSGGQWQRVAVARTLMRRNRDLLILDEPSAGLDAEAETRLHRRLAEHRAGRTSLLVSHRIGTIRDADQIAVLADGRITERGSHSELLAAGGLYARLFRLQARGYDGTADQLVHVATTDVDPHARVPSIERTPS